MFAREGEALLGPRLEDDLQVLVEPLSALGEGGVEAIMRVRKSASPHAELDPARRTCILPWLHVGKPPDWSQLPAAKALEGAQARPASQPTRVKSALGISARGGSAAVMSIGTAPPRVDFM